MTVVQFLRALFWWMDYPFLLHCIPDHIIFLPNFITLHTFSEVKSIHIFNLSFENILFYLTKQWVLSITRSAHQNYKVQQQFFLFCFFNFLSIDLGECGTQPKTPLISQRMQLIGTVVRWEIASVWNGNRHGTHH